MAYQFSKLYHDNLLYLFFWIIQLCLCIGSVVYFAVNYPLPKNDRVMMQVEWVIFGCMSIDFVIYHMVYGIVMTCSTLIEFLILIGFSISLVMYLIIDPNQVELEVEIGLIVSRLCVLMFRLVLLVYRMKENSIQRNSVQKIEISTVLHKSKELSIDRSDFSHQ